jgi:hypothetical protein
MRARSHAECDLARKKIAFRKKVLAYGLGRREGRGVWREEIAELQGSGEDGANAKVKRLDPFDFFVLTFPHSSILLLLQAQAFAAVFATRDVLNPSAVV